MGWRGSGTSTSRLASMSTVQPTGYPRRWTYPPGGGIVEQIRRAAKVVQMHLIQDHTRQQEASVPSRIDSAEDLHWTILPYSDPEFFTEEPPGVGIEATEE